MVIVFIFIFYRLLSKKKQSGIENPLSVSMMDVREDGNLDFMVTNQDKNKVMSIKVLKNNMNVDAAFLKVAGMLGVRSYSIYSHTQTTTYEMR